MVRVSEVELYEYLHTVGRAKARGGHISVEEGEDVASEAYLKIVSSKYGLATVSWKGLASKAFNNALIDRIRRNTIQKEYAPTGQTQRVVEDEPEWNVMLDNCLDALDEVSGEVWLLDYCEYEAAEGAKMLGLTTPAYKSRLYRAKKRLKEVFF